MEKSLLVGHQSSTIASGQKLYTHKARLLPQKRKLGGHHQGLVKRETSKSAPTLSLTRKSEKTDVVLQRAPKAHTENVSMTGDLAAHFLSTYFREMGQLSTLNAEQELAMGENLAALETQLWEKILSLVPIYPALIPFFTKNLPARMPGFSRFEQSAAQLVKKLHTDEKMVLGAELKKEMHSFAAALQAGDLDRVWIAGALSELKGWVSKSKIEADRWSAVSSEIERIHAEAEKVKNEFVKANLRLVVSLARRFYQGRMSLPDLIQEGNIGLIKAVERFDYRRGYRFSTYASWWIRHTISRALADKGRAVRVPVHMIDTYYRITRSRTELTNRLGRQPSSEELSQEAQVSIDRIEKMNGYLLEYSFSIDQSVSDDDKRQFVDMIEDESKESQPMTQMIDKSIHHEVELLFTALAPIEADVLRQRFGLGPDTEEEQTLKEIGKKYHLSRERIRQIQEQALDKIRKALLRKELI